MHCACSDVTCHTGGSGHSDAVDIFDVRSGVWTTAALSMARSFLVATSLPNDGVAIFAGGKSAVFANVDVIHVWSVGGWRT